MRRILSCLAAAAMAAILFAPGNMAWAQEGLSEEQLLARFAHEPLVQQVQDAAIRYYQVHPDRIKSLRRNAQLKALVPSISGKFSNALFNTKRRMYDGLYVQGLPANIPKEDEAESGDVTGFSIGIGWDLDRLVFNAEVLDVQSLIGILDGVVREVTTVYYIRRRLQIDMVLRPPKDLAAKISQRIRVEELTGLLDALTGGYMSRSISKGKKKVGELRSPIRMRKVAEGDSKTTTQ